MTNFYSCAWIVLLSASLFLGASSPGAQRDYQFRQNLEQLQRDQQIDQLRRQQEQNERRQLNEIAPTGRGIGETAAIKQSRSAARPTPARAAARPDSTATAARSATGRRTAQPTPAQPAIRPVPA
jgi:hypothetical protein